MGATAPTGAGPSRVTVDLAVVGAGPVGLYAAYCSGFRGLSTAVVDALAEPGGQVVTLYAEKAIHDVAGHPSVTGRELVVRLVEQAARYDPVYLLGAPAIGLSRTGPDGLLLTLGDEREVACRAVVVAGGIGSFVPRPLPALEAFAGRGLVHAVPRLDRLAGHDVVVVGGGDSAVDWALALEPVAATVTVVHRRATFRAHAASVRALRASTVRVLTDAQVVAAAGGRVLEEVTVQAADGSRTVLPARTAVAALGFVADLGPLEAWGFEVRDRRIVVDSRMATTVPGVFAAGDITDYPGKVRIIAVGFGEAATAVSNAAVLLDPEADLFPGHSSERQG